MKTKKIADIIDANGTPVTVFEIDRFIGIDELYEYCRDLKNALEQLSDKGLRSVLATLITRIKVAYFYKILQEGGKLKPISLKGNMLVDGRRRLWAHMLNGDTEVEYL